MSAPLFRAATKDNPPGDGKGTLTDLWKKGASHKHADHPMDLTDDAAPAGARAATENVIAPALEVTPEAAAQGPRAEGDGCVREHPAPLPTVTEAGEEPSADPTAEPEDGDKADKKRKRISYSDAQTATLQALFAQDPYPTTQQKRDCASKLGMELAAVTKWLERRRKQSRTKTGVPVGRPSKAAAAAAGLAKPPAATDAQPDAGATTPADSTLGPMDVDTADVASAGPTPAAQFKVPHTMAKPAAPAAAKPAGTAPKAPASAEAPRPVLSQHGIDLAHHTYEGERLQVVDSGLLPPLVDLATAAKAPCPYSDARLASLIAGQLLPLQQLAAAVLPTFSDAVSASLTVDALRSRIVDLATRKSHAPKDPANGAAAVVDALGDDSPAALWQWELRDAKALPKEQRAAALVIKRHATRVMDRLKALSAANQATLGHSPGPQSAKLTRALEALAKTKSLKEMHEEARSEAAAAAAKAEASSATAAAAAEKEAEKERHRLEKEAEKELHRLEKGAEKERHRLEREADRERKAAEAEEKKLRRKTGFADAQQLNKTANKFKSFFSKAKPGASPSNPDTSQLSSPGSGPSPPSHHRAGGSSTKPPPAAAPRFLKPMPDNLHLPPAYSLADEAIDAALAGTTSSEQTVAEWQTFLQRTRAERRAATAANPRRKELALPPSWARRRGAMEDAQARLQSLRDSGVDPAAVRMWRRKFLWFNSDSQRPPYYGSWPRAATEVGPRRYLGREQTLDYEVMSDQEWEEEPEGSSLSGADSMSEGGGGEEEDMEENSFMVDDGYLSAGEGVCLEDEDVADSDGEAQGGQGQGSGAAGGAEAGADATARERKALALQVQLDRARRAGRPLIISRLRGAVDGGGGGGGFIAGDPGLLEALAMEVLVPGVSVTVPEDPALEGPAAGAAVPTKTVAAAAGAVNAAGGEGGAAGTVPGSSGRGSRAEALDDLAPALAAFVRDHSRLTKPKIVEGFIEAHPGRKISKKWAADKISEVAARQGAHWVLKPAAPAETLTAATAVLAVTPAAGVAVPAMAAAAGPLDRLIKKAAQDAAGGFSPAFVAALKGPPPALSPLPPLRVPAAPPSPGNAYWSSLLQHIEDADAARGATFAAAFDPEALSCRVRHMPAFVPAALVAAVGACDAATPLEARTKLMGCLRHTIDALAALEMPVGGQAATGHEATLSQQAWGQPRGTPVAASLEELCKEPTLLHCLVAGLEGAAGKPDGSAHALAALCTLAASAAGIAALRAGEPALKARLADCLRGGELAAAKEADEVLRAVSAVHPV